MSPQLKCGDNLGPNVCFRHSATNPVTFMRFTQCSDPNQVCAMGNDYAWVESDLQFKGSIGLNDNSLVKNKNTIAYCHSPNDFRNNLLPGRNCSHDTQCLDGSCNKFGICAGKAINEPCH